MDSGSQSPLDPDADMNVPDADMDVPDDLPAEEEGTEKVSVFVQTECMKTRSRSNQTKVTGRSIGEDMFGFHSILNDSTICVCTNKLFTL